MKTSPQKNSLSSHPSGRIEGAALVIVLAFLVILTGLVVGFLSSVTNEATNTAASSAAVTTRALADTAVQLDIAQIRDATVGFAHNSSDGTVNTAYPVCWASQPGAIRTYDTNASNVAIYKLYSSTNMVDTTGTNSPTNDASSTNWGSNPALYTDLNAPVVVAVSGSTLETNYPIMDPTLAQFTNGSLTTNTNFVEGFTISNAPASASAGSLTNAAPMPVTWLYVLQNGAVIAPDSTSTTNATFANAPVHPSSTNPIVGRIAYWTDDETCKLNINTASEGSYWATPSFSTLMDLNMAKTQPVAGEFNRFPAHPASTSLSPVLWSYLGLANPEVFMGAIPGNPYDQRPTPTNYSIYATNVANSFADTTVSDYYTNLMANLTPRYVWGASYAGMSNTLQSNNFITSLPTRRFFTSVDELVFSATNTTGSLTNRSTNPLGQGNAPGITPADAARLRFFLTVDSRAPEVNPYNLPKITMWPVPDTNTGYQNPVNPAYSRAATDQKVIFCSTLGLNITNNSYYFTRYDPTSQNNDIVKAGAVTGRNQLLYNYMRNLMNQPVPGFRGTFTSGNKWNTLQADQISTLIFDYIRSCINIVDVSTFQAGSPVTNSGTNFHCSYTTPLIQSNYLGSNYIFPTSGTGQVVPILITSPSGNTTKGLGRFPTVRSGTLWMMARGANQPPLLCHPDGRPIVYDASGNQISIAGSVVAGVTNYSYIPYPAITNVLQGTAVAHVNILHPWTAPNATTNIYQAKSGGIPLLANTFVTGTAASQWTNNITTINAAQFFLDISVRANNQAIYPLFDLTGAQTNAYPTLYATNSVISSVVATTNTGAALAPLGGNNGYTINSTHATNSAIPITNASGGITNTIFATNAMAWGANPSTTITSYANLLSHSGLPFLPIQNPQTGAFDLININYKDNNTNSAGANYLTAGQTRVEAVFFPDLVNVSPGQIGLTPNLNIQITGLDQFTYDGNSMGFPKTATMLVDVGSGASDLANPYNNDFTTYGQQDALYDTAWFRTLANRSLSTKLSDTNTPFYATNTIIFTGNTNTTFSFSAGTISIALQTTNGATVQTIAMNFPAATAMPIPKLHAASVGAEVNPYGYNSTVPGGSNNQLAYPPQCPNIYPNNDITNSQSDLPTHQSLTFDNSTTNPLYTIVTNTINDLDRSYGHAHYYSRLNVIGNGGEWGNVYQTMPPDMLIAASSLYTELQLLSADTIQSVEALYGDTRMLSTLSNVAATFYTNNPYYGYSNSFSVNGWPAYLRNAFSLHPGAYPINGGIVGTLCSSSANATNNNRGYINHWTNAGGNLIPLANAASSITNVSGAPAPSGIYDSTNMMSFIYYKDWPAHSDQMLSSHYYWPLSPQPYTTPTCDFVNPTFSAIWQSGGDFDNGSGPLPDGPFINKVDEGYGTNPIQPVYHNLYIPYFFIQRGGLNKINPYYDTRGSNQFSPSRLVQSAVQLGSLPVGFASMGSTANPSPNILTNSWLTLQFSPNPNSPNTTTLATRNTAAGYSQAGSLITNTILPDFVLLDYFTMPLVDPYPISDPFSTAGKVNMNYQIVPFGYINRDTALRGVMKSVMITAVPESDIAVYKTTAEYRVNNDIGNAGWWGCISSTNAGGSTNFAYYYPINASNTLAQFTNRFGQNDLFHSASEICALWLYPSQQPTPASPYLNTNPVTGVIYDTANLKIQNWWYGTNTPSGRMGLTGDNLRERPYNYLYPRLTTKSNTYQIHYRVQTLKQVAANHGSAQNWQWIDPVGATRGSDKIVGELRGSAMIERYIDPSDPQLSSVDFTTNVPSTSASGITSSMDAYYKYRVFNVKQFNP